MYAVPAVIEDVGNLLPAFGGNIVDQATLRSAADDAVSKGNGALADQLLKQADRQSDVVGNQLGRGLTGAAVVAGVTAVTANAVRSGATLSMESTATAGNQVSAEAALVEAAVCFVAGTSVATPDGAVAIEDLDVGDLVLSRDPDTGKQDYKQVLRRFVTPDRSVLSIHLRNAQAVDSTIEVTGEHPFWVTERGWVVARALHPGDLLSTSTSDVLEVVESAEGRRATVYNVEVADFHTYFAGDDGAWVHNNPCSQGGKPISLPAWGKIIVDWTHIFERHMEGGPLAGVGGRTYFPGVMNAKAVMSAVRAAYQSSTKIGIQWDSVAQEERVLLEGQGGGYIIRMWFNKTLNLIETAFPVGSAR
jgi:hypothetical protein